VHRAAPWEEQSGLLMSQDDNALAMSAVLKTSLVNHVAIYESRYVIDCLSCLLAWPFSLLGAFGRISAGCDCVLWDRYGILAVIQLNVVRNVTVHGFASLTALATNTWP
jgi:hypothetical protein